MGSSFLIDSKPPPVNQQCFDLSDFLCQDKIILSPFGRGPHSFFGFEYPCKTNDFRPRPIYLVYSSNVFLQLINNSVTIFIALGGSHTWMMRVLYTAPEKLHTTSRASRG